MGFCFVVVLCVVGERCFRWVVLCGCVVMVYSIAFVVCCCLDGFVCFVVRAMYWGKCVFMGCIVLLVVFCLDGLMICWSVGVNGDKLFLAVGVYRVGFVCRWVGGVGRRY